MIGARALTVGGSAARREYLFTVSEADACSGCGFLQEVWSPTPGFDHFSRDIDRQRDREERGRDTYTETKRDTDNERHGWRKIERHTYWVNR